MRIKRDMLKIGFDYSSALYLLPQTLITDLITEGIEGRCAPGRRWKAEDRRGYSAAAGVLRFNFVSG